MMKIPLMSTIFLAHPLYVVGAVAIGTWLLTRKAVDALIMAAVVVLVLLALSHS